MRIVSPVDERPRHRFHAAANEREGTLLLLNRIEVGIMS
jgi:hypothetical protein